MSPEYQGWRDFKEDTTAFCWHSKGRQQQNRVCAAGLGARRANEQCWGFKHPGQAAAFKLGLACSEQRQTQHKSHKHHHCNPDHSRWMQGTITIICHSANPCISHTFYQRRFCACIQIIAQNAEMNVSQSQHCEHCPMSGVYESSYLRNMCL